MRRFKLALILKFTGVGARGTGAAIGGDGARGTALRRRVPQEEIAEAGQRAGLPCVSAPLFCQVMN